MHPPLKRTTPCIEQPPDNLQSSADPFIQALVRAPHIMEDAISLIRVDESTGGLIYRGVQHQVNHELASHIGIAADLLESGADRFFRYDPSTDYAFSIDETLQTLWAQRRDAPPSFAELSLGRQIRLRRLQIFAGRIANPFGIQAYERLRRVA